jgi:uncharacterized membrane protein YccC
MKSLLNFGRLALTLVFFIIGILMIQKGRPYGWLVTISFAILFSGYGFVIFIAPSLRKVRPMEEEEI